MDQPAETGPKLTDDLKDALDEVITEAFSRGISVQSDFARGNAAYVAAAASLGLITSRSGSEFGRVWRVTVKGLEYLQDETL